MRHKIFSIAQQPCPEDVLTSKGEVGRGWRWFLSIGKKEIKYLKTLKELLRLQEVSSNKT